jgi:mRNA-degrading endonuclease RelE of RelBE toxin-antitoxin system
MYKITLAPHAIKDISKLEKTLQYAVRDYLKNLESLENLDDIHAAGGEELKGNLKGLWKFKHKSFKDLRLIGYLKEEKWFLMLCIENRREVYKNKDNLARKIRNAKK